jgi:hypothetical protein
VLSSTRPRSPSTMTTSSSRRQSKTPAASRRRGCSRGLGGQAGGHARDAGGGEQTGADRAAGRERRQRGPDGDPASTATVTRRTTATWLRPPGHSQHGVHRRLRTFANSGASLTPEPSAPSFSDGAPELRRQSSMTWVERGRGLARTTPSRDAGRLGVGERNPVPVTPAATHAQTPAGDRPIDPRRYSWLTRPTRWRRSATS